MHRLSIDDLSKNFNITFKKPDHKYPKKISICNYSLKKHSLKSSKFAVSYRGPKLCNEFLSSEDLTWKMNFHISRTLLFKINIFLTEKNIRGLDDKA